MDQITRIELHNLLAEREGWCVSLYTPTLRAGHETEQNPLRLKNLLQEAETRLLAEGLRTPDVRVLLKPAEDLLVDPTFWRAQSDGLAVFSAAGEFYTYRLPLAFEAQLVVSHRFHIKPLLPFFANDGHFYILALSQNEVRLLQGTRHTVSPINLENVTGSLREALKFDSFQKEIQMHGGGMVGGGAPGGGSQAGIFHGNDPADEDKDRLSGWFKKLDTELQPVLEADHSPLVLAGVEYLLSLYREANSYPNVLDQDIRGNPEMLKPAGLHERAWGLVEPVFRRQQEAAIAQFHELASKGRTTTDLKKALKSAQEGRIASLFVPLGVEVWGSFDPDSQKA
ncbi:MAG TPA: hypothetical protein VN363_08285, partial [Anaerolineales bacterium]|nr:hypothetical protein [Anaerolineales bacterium]